MKSEILQVSDFTWQQDPAMELNSIVSEAKLYSFTLKNSN